MIAAIIQARMSSARLPGKVLLDLSGEPALQRVIERVKMAKTVDTVVVATSVDVGDDAVEKLCKASGTAVFRGSLEDVLSRYLGAAHMCSAGTVVRITGDCPLIDPKVIELCIKQFQDGSYDYISNCTPGERTFPRGLDVEVCTVAALERADKDAKESYEREHVMPYISRNIDGMFKIGPTLEATPEYARPYRLTLDYPEDYELIKRIYAHFSRQGSTIDVPEVLRYLDNHPELVAINAFRETDHVQRIRTSA